MLWKVALYLLLAWGLLCTVLTVTFFTRVGLDELRKRLRERTRPSTGLAVPLEQHRLATRQQSRRPQG